MSQDLQLTVADSRSVTINGLPALEVLSQQITQDPSTGQQNALAVQSMYIQYKSDIYVFHGVSTPQNFASYDTQFDRTMSGFRQLTDASKINVQPEKIKLVSVKSSGSLAQALQAYGIPSNRHKELAILNGMETNTQVSSGTSIKIVGK